MGIAGFDHVGAAMMLVRHGLDTAWAGQFGRTHLDTALGMRAYHVAEVLVGAGADLWVEDRDGYTPRTPWPRHPSFRCRPSRLPRAGG